MKKTSFYFTTIFALFMFFLVGCNKSTTTTSTLNSTQPSDTTQAATTTTTTAVISDVEYEVQAQDFTITTDWKTNILSANTTMNNFTINATTENTVTVYKTRAYYETFTTANRIQLFKAGSKEHTSISFTVLKGGLLTIYAKGMTENAFTDLALYKDDNLIETQSIRSIDFVEYSYILPDAGTYYLYATNANMAEIIYLNVNTALNTVPTETGFDYELYKFATYYNQGTDLDLTGLKVYSVLSNNKRIQLYDSEFAISCDGFNKDVPDNYSAILGYKLFTPISIPLTVSASLSEVSDYISLQGYARGEVTARITEESSKAVCDTEEEFLSALCNENIYTIEITEDMNLGTLECSSFSSNYAYAYKAHKKQPLCHPTLIASGIGYVAIRRNNMTIYSENGSTLKHCTLRVNGVKNTVIRNIKFDELWEWDDKDNWNYDTNNWSYIDVDSNANGLWIDHCEFGKGYDGTISILESSRNITISYCTFKGDDIDNPSQFVIDQINYLENLYDGTDSNLNDIDHNFYDLARGSLTKEQILKLSCLQKKGILIGPSTDESNLLHSVTIHNCYFYNQCDRMPRLRAGKVYMYNNYIDSQDIKTLEGISYGNIKGTSQALVTTENGCIILEYSYIDSVKTPIKANQSSGAGAYLISNSYYTYRETSYFGSSNDGLSHFISSETPASFETYGFTVPAYHQTKIFKFDGESLASFTTFFFDSTYGAGCKVDSVIDWLDIEN